MKWAALSLASVNVCSCTWHSFKALCISVAHFEEVLSSLSCSSNITKSCRNSKLQKGSDQFIKEVRLKQHGREHKKGH